MKRLLWTAACLLLVLGTAAQTQQGYVKTKGRLVNGSVVSGQRIAGVTVQVKGRNAVVSQQGGAFSFHVPSNKYSVQSVKKQGYVLSDPDVLSKQYSYSANPLIFVMETPSQQMEDKLAAERKLRRTLSRQLQQREDEIEKLKEQKELTEEQYHKALQDLYAEQEKSLNLVSQMAERYSRVDFDQLDEFNRRISDCIIEGRLAEADSLIKSKGDLKDRIAVHKSHHEANVQARKRLEASEAMELKDLNNLAEDCYNQFLIHKLQHNPDSAAYYIEQRALLDTTNIDWLYDAACYLKECGHLNKSHKLYLSLHRSSRTLQIDDKRYAEILRNIADYYFQFTDYSQADTYYSYAIDAYKRVDSVNINLPYCLNRLAWSKRFKGGNSRDAHLEAERIIDRIYDSPQIDINNIYKERSLFVRLTQNNHDYYNKVINYYQRALNEIIKQRGDKNENVAEIYIEIGKAFHAMGLLDNEIVLKSIEQYEKALSILQSVDSSHPLIGDLCSKIAFTYQFLNDTIQMVDYYKRAIDAWQDSYGEYFYKNASVIERLSQIQSLQGHHDLAIAGYERALDICNLNYGNYSPQTAHIYAILSEECIKTDRLDKALYYSERGIEVFHRCQAKNMQVDNFPNDYITGHYNRLARIYDKKGDKTLAISNYQHVLEIRESEFLNNNGETAQQTAIANISLGIFYINYREIKSALDYLYKGMDRAILLVGRMKNNQVDEIRLNIRESKKCYKNNDLYLALEYYVKALGYVGNNLPEKDAYISAINDCLNNFSYEVLQ